MKKSKIYKYFTILIVFILAVIGIVYSQLTNRHKAIVKTQVLHFTGLLDSDWIVTNGIQEYKMLSPTFLIDGIYKSMEGPKASRYIQLNQTEKLLWIKGFEVQAFDANTNAPLSNDYICHMNVDINDVN
ncbi:MAG: hypothetical protein E2604_09625, partial [Flavobacterium sp.]|nr:hypothetical protein [Flavobacterium sp.]